MKGPRSGGVSSPVASHPDGLLIVRLRKGDVDALGELYEKYKTAIFRTALAIMRDRGLAEDVLQECFLRLFINAERIQTDIPLGPWLYRVAVNLSYTWAKKSKRRAGGLEELLGRLKGPLHLLPERQVERIETHEKLHRAIENLPASHQVVVVLFYLEELSLREIAAVMQIPEGTVKSRLHYARESLRTLLAEKRSVPEMVYEFT